MPKTTSQLSEFTVVETIGSGSFGTCRKIARKSDGKVFVWKEVDYGGMSEKEKQLLVQEVNLLRELRHPHIVRYHDRIIDREHSTLYIVMEHCEGGDLRSVINECREGRSHVEEREVWKVLSQLLQALHECHKKRHGVHRVLHRDLKPANVFLDGAGNVKLGDFGLARILHHNFSLAQTFVGTPYYMSPELFSEQAYDEKSDLWSLGCLVYELCILSPPFTAKDQHTLAAKIVDGKVGRLPRHYSSQLQSIVDSLLVKEPSGRPDIATLLALVESMMRRLHKREQRPPESDRAGKEEQAKTKSSQELAVWETDVKQREREVERREGEVGKREREVEEREAGLIMRERAIGEREAGLIARERAVREREQTSEARGERRQKVMEGRKPLHPVQIPTSAKLVQHNKKRAHVHKKESVRFNLDPLM